MAAKIIVQEVEEGKTLITIDDEGSTPAEIERAEKMVELYTSVSKVYEQPSFRYNPNENQIDESVYETKGEENGT